MPRFSDDDVLDFLVAEAVVTHGLEAESEAQRKAEADAEHKEQTSSHREWADKHGLT